MSGKLYLSTDHHPSPHHLKKHGNETALGQSELFPVQMSGKLDKSTHSRTAKDYKNTVETSLGRSKLSPVQKSGKSDKSTCESPPTTLNSMVPGPHICCRNGNKYGFISSFY